MKLYRPHENEPYNVRCQTCHGAGCVSNKFTERAAFTRKQMELPDVDNCFCGTYGDDSRVHVRYDRRLAEITADGTPIAQRFTYRRGFVYKITCLMRTWLKHGPEIVRDHPITQVLISDFKLRESSLIVGRFIIFDETNFGKNKVPSAIARVLFQKLKGEGKHTVPPTSSNASSCMYCTEHDAIADLSQACIAWAKSVAKEQAR